MRMSFPECVTFSLVFQEAATCSEIVPLGPCFTLCSATAAVQPFKQNLYARCSNCSVNKSGAFDEAQSYTFPREWSLLHINTARVIVLLSEPQILLMSLIYHYLCLHGYLPYDPDKGAIQRLLRKLIVGKNSHSWYLRGRLCRVLTTDSSTRDYGECERFSIK